MDPKTPEEWKKYRIAQGWRPGNNGTKKRRWFVCRETQTRTEFAEDSRGNVRRFASVGAASRLADQLNRPTT